AIHPTGFAANIIAIGEWRGCINGGNMLPKGGEFLFQLNEHRLCFPLLELLVTITPVTRRCDCVMRRCPLSNLLVPHVGKYGHPGCPVSVFPVGFNQCHMSCRLVCFFVMDVAS